MNNGVTIEVILSSLRHQSIYLINLKRTIMRHLKTLLLVCAITFSSALFANNDLDTVKKAVATIITDEVEKLLDDPTFLIEDDIVATVKLTLNKDNEMVVLSVDSNQEFIETFIKSRLNYRELSAKLSNGQKTFIVPVRVIQEE